MQIGARLLLQSFEFACFFVGLASLFGVFPIQPLRLYVQPLAQHTGTVAGRSRGLLGGFPGLRGLRKIVPVQVGFGQRLPVCQITLIQLRRELEFLNAFDRIGLALGHQKMRLGQFGIDLRGPVQRRHRLGVVLGVVGSRRAYSM